MSRSGREHPRYAHEAAITLHVAGRAYGGRTTNVSRGGLCAEMADPIANGSDLDVDLRLVFDEETQSEPLRLPARVVWCTQVDEGYQVGLAFKPLGAERLEYLAMFLRYLGEAESSRPEKQRPSIDDRFG